MQKGQKYKKIKIDKTKLRQLEKTKNPFASLVRSVIYQQLSGKAAASILAKFIAIWPDKKFPIPQDILALNDIKFKSAGVSAQKAGYLRDLALKFSDGTIEPKRFSKMSDEDIREHLTRVKGIGTWTADMFLIFALNRPDILPTGDLAIRKGFMREFDLPSIPTEEEMQLIAKAYAPERTYLSLYLWDSLDFPKPKKTVK